MKKIFAEIQEASLEAKYLGKAIKEKKTDLNKLQEQLAVSENCRSILQEVAQAVQENVHSRVSEIVTSCLQTVFDSSYSFKICFEQKRGKTEAVLRFEQDGKEFDPLNSKGGGIADVASFACRVASIILSKPKSRRILFLDEPFKFVSKDHRPAIRNMLERLAEEFQMQIIFVTHIDELLCGKVIELKKN